VVDALLSEAVCLLVEVFCWALRAKSLDEGSGFGQQYLASWSGRSEWKVGRW
jgi:hypothetical protein